jgi:predicted metal-dependent hydrolase
MRLLIELRKEVEKYRSVVKNLRVSAKAIEFDLYVIDENSQRKSLEELGKHLGDVLTVRDLNLETSIQKKELVINEAASLFNQQRYWESHETLEQVWRRETNGPEKDVQQGIILAASALVHFQKNENEVCLGMIPRALAKLDRWHETKYYNLNILKLKHELLAILETKKITPIEIESV